MKSDQAEIPKTGRIGRWATIIEQETDHNIAEKVMENAEQLKSLDYVGKAAWIKGAVERLEHYAGEEKAKKIMEECGRKCCGQTYRKKARELMGESKSLKEFIEKLNKAGLGGGRLTFKDENTITGGYNHCYCGQVKQTKEPLPRVYCYCSAGWYKQLFESALGRPVDVELVQSIVSGAHTCEFIIKLNREKND